MADAAGAVALDRILDPVGRCLTPEVARALMDLRTDAETQARIDELADKATEGTLPAPERAEYEEYGSHDQVGATFSSSPTWPSRSIWSSNWSAW